MRTTVNKTITTWKLGKELVTANIAHHGMSLFGTTLEILLVDEDQAAQAQAVVDAHDGVDTIGQRLNAAESQARNIPSWSIWNEADMLSWWNANLGDSQVDAVANLTDAKAIMKKQNAAIKSMAHMLLAMRDRLWPQIPEG